MDINERLHHEWLGMAQPEGLVVTASALKAAEANITWPVTELQAVVADLAGEKKRIVDLRGFLREVLDWGDELVVSASELPAGLRVRLEGGELLGPTFALRSVDEDTHEGGAAGEAGVIGNGAGSFVFLVEETQRGDLDAAVDDKRWSATAHQRFERLLRETGVLAGLLTNGRDFRLVVAPKGESAGWVTFRLAEMLSVDGRPLLGAFHMLLNERRISSLAASKRLGGLLRASREYQNTVSNKLREQILGALRDLLGGFQHADRVAEERILGPYRPEHLGEVYSGLVTVLMRMVFVLYAEERSLLPMESELYASSYSLSRLYASLQEDWNRHGDTINDRFGAWGRVITLFRLLHDGVRAADGLLLPPRKGAFFDPDAFAFLEGRDRAAGGRQAGQILDLPRVSDGVVYRVLDRLLRLDGERLQYKGLDVEQIGSVYEGLMGFEIEVAVGDSLCLTPEHVVVNLDALVKLGGAERLKELKAQAGLDLKDKTAGEVKDAKTTEALHAALGKRISPRQPGVLARGTLYIQPGEERRKTGSHYTPRTLTEPIVATTLRPILERLGPEVTPAQILDLKICDPAMGSGAFLVEACRQLADVLVKAWRRSESMPELPRDEEPVLHARRLIAQRCIYGVDKNPLAVDLARLSLWLVTFAREHPFTFVDHSLRNGDSLVGLLRDQIFNLSFDPKKGHKLSEQARNQLFNAVRKAEGLRAEIHAIGDPPDNDKLAQLWDEANEALDVVRTVGDAMVATYFSENSDKARRAALDDLVRMVPAWISIDAYSPEVRGIAAGLRQSDHAVPPLHWEIEFPEVFHDRDGSRGFDCIVGNPPFSGKNGISAASGEVYIEWLMTRYDRVHGNADLCAYFFRQSAVILRSGGTMGFVATNTIAQGDTRTTGLRALLDDGLSIFSARRNMPWSGQAAVFVSVVHMVRDAGTKRYDGGRFLDGLPVHVIDSRLRPKDEVPDPVSLATSRGVAFAGAKLFGQGFVLSEEERDELVARDPANAVHIQPYMGGEDVNGLSVMVPHRYVINFGQLDLVEAERWPDLLAIVRERVKPERAYNNRSTYQKYWWRLGESGKALYGALSGLSRCLVTCQVSRNLCFAWLPIDVLFAHTISVIALETSAAFACLQSRIHETWARALASTMKDDLRYAPSDCFETFPFPLGVLGESTVPSREPLDKLGEEYDRYRAGVMRQSNEGLTRTYNRFHDPAEHSPHISKLRELHAGIDRAVLDAYGWTDIAPVYTFRTQPGESPRFTWAEPTRAEVFDRLLLLNQATAAAEAKEAIPMKKEIAQGKKVSAKRPSATRGETLALPMDDAPMRIDRGDAAPLSEAPGVVVKTLYMANFSAIEESEIALCPGINVFIGANSTGKSHAMKALYATLKVFEEKATRVPLEFRLQDKFAMVFRPDNENIERLIHGAGDLTQAHLIVRGSAGEVDLTINRKKKHPLEVHAANWRPDAPCLFVPSREILAMFEGFLGAYKERKLSFDETYYDACFALSQLMLAGEALSTAEKLVKPLEDALGGKVVLQGTRFYLKGEQRTMEAHLVGEGFRKIAALAHLILNGSIVKGSILFWDEPEAGLNPRLTSLVANLLVEMAAAGVQVVATTHDYLLSSRLSLLAEYGRRPDVAIRFFGFQRATPTGPVVVDAADTLATLASNPILEEFLRHYDFERTLFDEAAVGGGK